MDPFLGEIRIVAFNFAPVGWARCDGQLIAISQNTALFAVLGTTYGGNGTSTFALPNFQGATPVGFGQASSGAQFYLGQTGGQDAVTLLESEMPSHVHAVMATSSAPTDGDPSGAVLATPGTQQQAIYATTASATTPGAAQAISASGGGGPHNNRQPFLTLTFIIALQGVFPPRP